MLIKQICVVLIKALAENMSPASRCVRRPNASSTSEVLQQQSSQQEQSLNRTSIDEQNVVPVTTIYGIMIQSLVYPGIPILDFKTTCMEEALWHGCPIEDCISLAIRVDLANTMADG